MPADEWPCGHEQIVPIILLTAVVVVILLMLLLSTMSKPGGRAGGWRHGAGEGVLEPSVGD